MARALVIGMGGIGTALGQALRARGDDVVTLSRSSGGPDLTDGAAVDAALSGIEGRFETVLVVTGILAPEGGAPEKALKQIDAAAMAQVFAVNAIGPALVLRHLPRLLPRQGRSACGVLSARVGSIADNRLGGWYSYRASKAALNQVLHTAAIEMARTHPEAVLAALHPGTVETSFTEGYDADKLTPEQSAGHLLSVLDGMTPEDSGGFRDWRGEVVPW